MKRAESYIKMSRIEDKIEEIEKYLSDLEEFIPLTFEDYKQDLKTKAACEHYFEKIIEACEDLTFLIIKEQSLEIPEEDKTGFNILFDKDLISREIFEKLKDAKGMRNIITHEYGKIDDELVFESVAEQLIPDVRKFIKELERFIKHEKP